MFYYLIMQQSCLSRLLEVQLNSPCHTREMGNLSEV